MNIKKFLNKKFAEAMKNSGVPENFLPKLHYSTKSGLNEYQVDGIIRAAQKMQKSPVNLAQSVLKNLKIQNIIQEIKINPVGFINFQLDPEWLTNQLCTLFNAVDLCDIKISEKKKTIVIDYSSPNLAKEMHVGHLRSTIIGDTNARILEFLGHKVIRVNHVGDWGMQFGVLIAFIKEKKYSLTKNTSVQDIESWYCAASNASRQDAGFLKKSQNCILSLQKKKQEYLKLWSQIVQITLQENQRIYERLNVTLDQKNIQGESFYSELAQRMVQELLEKKIAQIHEEAVIVNLKEFTRKNKKNMGVIIQKKDKSFLYSTTEIASIKHRCQELKANRLIYYVDSRQSQHLKQCYIIAKQASYIGPLVEFEHQKFGVVLGQNHKPFKTRQGNTIKLKTLLNEAYEKTYCFLKKKHTTYSEKQIKHLACVISTGALKYNELSKNRTTDYVFKWEHVLRLEGNTALYMQYAFTRILSILKRQKFSEITCKILLLEKIELELAKHLLSFGDVLLEIEKNGMTNILCEYLYKLANLFSNFYESCPILKSPKEIQVSRMQIAYITAKILKKGLDLLGIELISSI